MLLGPAERRQSLRSPGHTNSFLFEPFVLLAQAQVVERPLPRLGMAQKRSIVEGEKRLFIPGFKPTNLYPRVDGRRRNRQRHPHLMQGAVLHEPKSVQRDLVDRRVHPQTD